MAAITQRLLHLRSTVHSYARPHPYTLYHFSSASDPDTQSDIPNPDPNSETRTPSPLSSSFSSVKASLQQQPSPQKRDRYPRTPSLSSAGSTVNIRRQLSEFQSRSSALPSSSSTGISLEEMYERNINSSGSNSGRKPSLDPIRASLSQLNPGAQNDGWKSRFAKNMKLKGDANAIQDSTTSIGGSDNLMHLFRGKGQGSLRSTASRPIDDHLDLGKNLKMLRPQVRKGKWFSLQELSDRLAKLKEAPQEHITNITGIRGAITAIQKDPKQPMKNLGFLSSKGGTESYLLLPPKLDLVDKYFHPDNMSSAEKIKLELKKVRDEFKMSESDCGSARVQVAQLTIKIKHLSTVLKRKDKHSRKGLQAMVQRRKKLLKYLRQTDWDSYCLVLSKLGLRDNPDIKA